MQNKCIGIDSIGNIYYKGKNGNLKLYSDNLTDNDIENIMRKLWYFEEHLENLQEDLERCQK